MNGQRPTKPAPHSSSALKDNAEASLTGAGQEEAAGEFGRKTNADSNSQEKRAERFRGHDAVSSQPAGDPNEHDPEERSDMIGERRNPGMHGGGGDSGWKPSKSADR